MCHYYRIWQDIRILENRKMRKIFIVTALIVCTSVLFSCGFINRKKVIGQTPVFVKSQSEKRDNKAEELS